jgi:hypothetical protein
MRFLLQKAFPTSNKLPKVWFCLVDAPSIIVLIAVTVQKCRIIQMSVFVAIVFFQDPTKSRFCGHDQEIEEAYTELLDSSKQTLGCMLELQEVWLPALCFSVYATL